MPATTSIKRTGLALVAFVVAGFGALLALSLLVPADTVREAVKAQIMAVTGLDPILGGEVVVSLFPTGTVSFDDVSLGDNRTGAAALTSERLTARLRFFPFLAGRIEIADVSLVRPTITIAFNSERGSNWSGHIDTLARALLPNPSQPPSFSEIRIEGGTVILRDAAHKVVERLTNVEFALAWPRISKSFGATGRFVWHDETIDAALSLSDFVAALMGERSGLKVRLAGAPIKAAFDGYISHQPMLRMEGMLAADAASLRDTLRWAAGQSPPGGGFGRFALKAQTTVTGGNVALSGVNIELDGNVGEGALTFATDTRRTLQGTLAADGIDLTPYISAVRLVTANERNWDRLPITLEGLTGIDVDLRLSAAQVTVANAKLGRTAVAANLRRGQLTVTVGESQAFGGVVKGSFGLANAQAGGVDVKAQLQFADVDLVQCLGDMFGIRKLEGKGNLGLTFDSTGTSVYDLTKSLNGNATLTSRKGAITGFNVEMLLRRLERTPLANRGEFRSGKTPYDQLTVTLKVVQGIASIEDVRIEGAAVRLGMAGSASIPSRDLDLQGTATLLPSGGATATNAAPPFELPFVVQGPWDDPVMLPDAQTLIMRSGASGPLYNAVKNRSMSDSVRSVLDRLNGQQPDQAPALAAEPARP